MSPAPSRGELALEVRRFEALPVSAEVALVALEGRLSADSTRWARRPALVVEGAGPALEIAPVSGGEVVSAPAGTPWRATYAVPLAALDTARFSLAIGAGLLLELPEPDDAGADDADTARLARLAREGNDLRRKLHAAGGRASEAAEERDRVAAELEALRTAATAERDGLTADRIRFATERDDAAAERDRLRAELDTARADAAAEHDRLRAERDRLAAERTETAAERDRLAAELDQLRAELASARDAQHRGEEELAGRGAVEEGLRTALAAAERRLAQPAPGGGDDHLRRELAEAREETERRVAEALAEAAREHEAAVAAQRTRATLARRELQAARAELEALRRDHDPPSPRWNGGNEITATDTRPRTEATKAVAQSVYESPDGEEAVRVLTPGSRRPRHDAADEEEPTELSPGAAEIGARTISGAAPRRAGGLGAARISAIAALAIVAVALILVAVVRV